MDDKVQVLILSGFLGSGKTTVLMQLIAHLHEKHGADYKIAIIENEIGSVSVDSSVISEAGYSVTDMLAGCVCCTLIGQLVPALDALRTDMNPNLIILEATGVATPGSMQESIDSHGSYVTRICTLVDASRWERIKVPLQNLLEGQLEPADVVCINKVDLVDEDQLVSIKHDVALINNQVACVRVSAASPMDDNDLETLLGGIA